ncbi:RNA polymerase factor sigma-54 [Candidatus Cardinium hertigii]|uniref:RNA polymerase sigma-54 factor n=1 Tax=Candidatus Cardinium hertigii TaxID=247481 RepID=A0A3N2QBK9_9BACT|nr:RNA polymerase factor sigma-54 [Candidatus Cardinium hertigii]ROT47193.1 RNA polymerase sigma-54 factor [Candidatus Cardinium hertigii]ROT47201.1 RNA polymerase sigma-54 factor [Candidatus Cardinium hertigii]
MQKLQLEQKCSHKLSGQQIQFIKLLQVPSIALNTYISKEIASNPLLDETLENDDAIAPESEAFTHNFSDYYPSDLNKKNYKTEISRDKWTPTIVSLQEKLKEQLHWLHLSEVGYIIGEHLIGSLDQNGFLPCDLEIIVQDLHVIHYVELSVQEVEEVLIAIQQLDPPGIAARNLQECLLIQLNRQNQTDPVIQLARDIISSCFEEFTKKHYESILKKLAIADRHLLKDALAHIAHLNPRPGGNYNGMEQTNNFLSPDFIIVENQGNLSVELVNYPIYKPRFNKKYLTMLEAYEKKTKTDTAYQQDRENQEIIDFLKKKLEDAKYFMEALGQRNQTLLKTMQAILELQYNFFLEGEETDRLTPMVLQNVADKVGMDASTISRIVNQKSVQGKFGVYLLKFFFSEGISKSTGENISNKAVKNRILELINSENKQNPYPDRRMGEILITEGYSVARRTVTKYREELGLPVARLRKELA